MIVHSWIRRLFAMKATIPIRTRRAASSRPRKPGGPRLSLETLEDRLAPAMVFQVNTPSDTHEVAFPGIDANGNTSLRAAVEAINSLPDGYTNGAVIDLPFGTYDLSLGELDLHPQAPVLPVSIIGQGNSLFPTVIDAQGLSRVLEIQPGGGPVTLQNVILQNGRATDSGALGTSQALGGAILDESTPLTLNYSYVQTSQTVGSPSYPDAEGGGIYASQSPVLINGGYVDFNQATSQAGGWTLGGGIDVVGGPLTLINSSAEANLVAGGIQAAGGGINATGADVSLASSVVANNSVTAGNAAPDNFGPSAQGGGIYFNSSYAAHTLTISSSYVYSNQLTGGRGGDGSAATFVIPSGSYAPQFIADQGVPLGAGANGLAGGNAEGGGIYVEEAGGDSNGQRQ